MTNWELNNYKPPNGTYLPRHDKMAVIVIGKKQRHCYNCNGIIPKGEKHLGVDNHLASGRRNNFNFCYRCVAELVKELLK